MNATLISLIWMLASRERKGRIPPFFSYGMRNANEKTMHRKANDMEMKGGENDG